MAIMLRPHVKISSCSSHILFFVLLLSFQLFQSNRIIVTSASSDSNRNGGALPLSPIRHLESSLAASSAQGTVVAVLASPGEKGEEEECVVILSCSSGSDSLSNEAGWNLTTDNAITTLSDTNQDDDAEQQDSNVFRKLTFLPRGPARIPLHTSDNKKDESRILHILHEQSGTCCAVTGFASDARHIVNVAARYVSDHELLYGSGGDATTTGPAVHKLVKDVLAKKLSAAAFAAGGRPYGLQFLVVGNRPGYGKKSSSPSLQMYTIDPSGGWRHWGGGGTAVGRNAALVRKNLYSALMRKDQTINVETESVGPSRPKGWSNALDMVMKALVESTHDDDDLLSRAKEISSLDDDDDDDDDNETSYKNKKYDDMRGKYDAIVVFSYPSSSSSSSQRRNRRSSLCAAINRETVAESYWKCIQQIAKEKKEQS